MMAMDRTIAGAASGETAEFHAPKGSQSQAKGQKSIKYLFVIFIILMTRRLERIQSLFLLALIIVHLFTCLNLID